MNFAVTIVLLLAAPTWADAAQVAVVTRSEFARALKAAAPKQLDGVYQRKISAASIQVIRCLAPDQEPTEFECVWIGRTAQGWKKHKTWLAIDGKGWHVID